MSEIVKRIEQFAKNQDITISEIERKISASKGVLYKAVKNNTDISAKWIGALVENYPILSANYILTGKGDMLLPSGEHQEPAAVPHEPVAVPHEPVGEKPAGKSGNKSAMLVADEPQGYYPTSPTEQVLRQLVSALERTIKDKEEIISLLKERQSK